MTKVRDMFVNNLLIILVVLAKVVVLVMIYALLMFRLKSEKKASAAYRQHWKLIWVIILGYKLWNEWYLALRYLEWVNKNGGWQKM